LRQEAQRCGQPRESDLLQLLAEHLPPLLEERRAGAIAMLNRWVEEDAQLPSEDAAANTDVLHALDEDRASYRKLFAEYLKDDRPRNS